MPREKTAKEKVEDATDNVVGMARLFLNGMAYPWQLQEALDKHDDAVDAWDKEVTAQIAERKATEAAEAKKRGTG